MWCDAEEKNYSDYHNRINIILKKMHFKSIIKGEASTSIYADWVNGKIILEI